MRDIILMGEEEVAPISANEMIAASQILDRPILEVLLKVVADEAAWATNLPLDDYCILAGFPDKVGKRLVEVKLFDMAKRGLLDGCFCGCRGDYQITQAGLDALGISPSSSLRREFGVADYYRGFPPAKKGGS